MKEFSLERVTPSAAVFDMEKLYWLNRHYIKSWPERNLQRWERGSSPKLVTLN